MDLTGQRFGKLVVIKRAEDYIYPSSKKHEPRWLCQCDCGNAVKVIQHNLTNGHCHNCGCSNLNNFKDLTGQRFGKLVVIKRAEDYIVPNTNKKEVQWLCQCDCGNKTIARGSQLRSGHTKSCGCYSIEKSTKHGQYKTRLYKIWLGMRSRCYNKNTANYYRYGGRGIKVCDEWNNSFESFMDWALKNGYDEDGGRNCTINRIDNDGNYCPENCNFANSQEQANNRSTNTKITVNGEKITIAQASRKYNISAPAMYVRKRSGWDDEDIINTPLYDYILKFTVDGVTDNLTNLSKKYNISRDLVYDRLRNGWDIEKALKTPKLRNNKEKLIDGIYFVDDNGKGISQDDMMNFLSNNNNKKTYTFSETVMRNLLLH